MFIIFLKKIISNEMQFHIKGVAFFIYYNENQNWIILVFTNIIITKKLIE